MKAKSSGIIWVASYCKSGNTWVRCFIASLLANGITPDLDQLGKICTSGASRAWIEDILTISTEDLTPAELARIRLEAYRQQKLKNASVCYLKIHDRFDPKLFQPEFTAGIIYIVRDPRDVAPSLAHHMNISLDEAIRRMNLIDYGLCCSVKSYWTQTPQVLGSWSSHVNSWLNQKESPLLLLRYEDLCATPEDQIARLAEFLGLKQNASLCDQVAHACRFEALQQAEPAAFNEKPSHMERFFRQGKAGSWQDVLSAEQAAHIVACQGDVMAKLGYSLSAL